MRTAVRGLLLGGQRFSPSSIGGMAWGYEADRLSGADADPIASWPDVSPNGRTVTQATGTAQPSLRLNQLNGLSVVRADGGDSLVATGWTLAQPFTLFVVAKTTATDAVNRNLVSQASGPAAILRKNTSNQLNLAAATNLSDPDAMGNGAWFMAAATANGVSSRVALNGATAVSGDAGTNGMTGVSVLGAWTGDMYAAYAWSGALSNAQLNALAAYFKTKTALSTWVNL